ncbi:MAG: hypothetical protein M3R06_03675 [Chloroflexota bacterium]|nr:hypothetical protein [Chloroflexota bacterium]
MDDMLKSILGGGDEPEEKTRTSARDFVTRYENGPPSEGFSGEEALDRHQRVAERVPADVYQQSAEEAFQRMSPPERKRMAELLSEHTDKDLDGDGQIDDPRQLARMATKVQQNNPGGLAGLFGGGGSGGGGDDLLSGALGALGGGRGQSAGGMGDLLSNPLAKAALGGIAAIALKKMVDR